MKGLIDKVLLELVGLPHVLDLAVHLVNFFWLDESRSHSESLYQSTPSCLKVMGGGGWVGGPCDFSVSPSPFGLDFGTSDSGLTIKCPLRENIFTFRKLTMSYTLWVIGRSHLPWPLSNL